MSLILALAALTTPVISCPGGSIETECGRADVAGKASLAGFAESSGAIGTLDLVASDGERSLVHVTGTPAGSGAGNADALFVGYGGKADWRQVDLEGWYDEASELLPKGYWLRGPASFRFDAMLAVVPIARDGDGNCCPRGGQALFDLSILGDRLVVDGMRFQPMQPAGAEVEQVIVRSKPPRQ